MICDCPRCPAGALTFDPAELDPGIRDFVCWLNHHRFETTDSGDGVTKLAAGWPPEEAMDVPHVFIAVVPEDMVSEAIRLRDLIQSGGDRVPEGAITASYDPANHVAILAVIGIDDFSGLDGRPRE